MTRPAPESKKCGILPPMSTPRPFYLPWLALAVLLVTGGLIYLLGPILTPFLAGALLAYMFDPLVDRLETHGWSRMSGTVAVIVLAGLTVFGLILIALPLFQGQFTELSQRLPAALDLLQTRFLPWLQQTFGIAIAPSLDTLKTWLTEHASESGANWLPTLQTGALAIVGVVVNLLLIPVVMFYLLKDWDVMVARVAALVPRDWMGPVTRVARAMDAVVGEFLRGQLAVMTILALYHAHCAVGAGSRLRPADRHSHRAAVVRALSRNRPGPDAGLAGGAVAVCRLERGGLGGGDFRGRPAHRKLRDHPTHRR